MSEGAAASDEIPVPPPGLMKLLRQVSVEAKAGTITPEIKAALKECVQRAPPLTTSAAAALPATSDNKADSKSDTNFDESKLADAPAVGMGEINLVH
jgi:hypothetical protein